MLCFLNITLPVSAQVRCYTVSEYLILTVTEDKVWEIIGDEAAGKVDTAPS